MTLRRHPLCAVHFAAPDAVPVELEVHRFGEHDGPDQLSFGRVEASPGHQGAG